MKYIHEAENKNSWIRIATALGIVATATASAGCVTQDREPINITLPTNTVAGIEAVTPTQIGTAQPTLESTSFPTAESTATPLALGESAETYPGFMPPSPLVDTTNPATAAQNYEAYLVGLTTYRGEDLINFKNQYAFYTVASAPTNYDLPSRQNAQVLEDLGLGFGAELFRNLEHANTVFQNLFTSESRDAVAADTDNAEHVLVFAQNPLEQTKAADIFTRNSETEALQALIYTKNFNNYPMAVGALGMNAILKLYPELWTGANAWSDEQKIAFINTYIALNFANITNESPYGNRSYGYVDQESPNEVTPLFTFNNMVDGVDSRRFEHKPGEELTNELTTQCVLITEQDAAEDKPDVANEEVASSAQHNQTGKFSYGLSINTKTLPDLSGMTPAQAARTLYENSALLVTDHTSSYSGEGAHTDTKVKNIVPEKWSIGGKTEGELALGAGSFVLPLTDACAPAIQPTPEPVVVTEVPPQQPPGETPPPETPETPETPTPPPVKDPAGNQVVVDGAVTPDPVGGTVGTEETIELIDEVGTGR